MKAVILAGGKGTRLLPYTAVFPKPLVPLGDRPILDIIVRQLSFYNFNDVVISVGYLGELIEAYFVNYQKNYNNVKISYIREKEPLGTAGSLRNIPDLNESFLVMNGDVLTTIDYLKLLEFHREKGGILTIAMHKRKVKIDLGVMEIDKDCRLLNYTEKPTMNYLVSMGIYVYEPRILNYIEPNKYFDFPDLVLHLLKNNQKVVGYKCDDYWLDLGSHEDYTKAIEEYQVRKDEFLPKREINKLKEAAE